eukprot:SAG11_NODE_4458_length_1888_cov_1.441587_2_plen_251_part_00
MAALKKKQQVEPEPEEEKPWVPHYASQNPFPERPKFRTSERPSLFEPANIDPTWQSLVAQPEAAGRARSALGWEYYHRLSELSYLFDSNHHKENVFSRLISRLQDPSASFTDGSGKPITTDDDIVNLAAIFNTDSEIYELANKRISLLQLRAKLGANLKKGQEGLLEVFESEVYGVLGPMPAKLDKIFQKCMSVWQKQTKQQIVKDAAKSASKGGGGGGGGGKKNKTKGEKGRAAGGGIADVMDAPPKTE